MKKETRETLELIKEIGIGTGFLSGVVAIVAVAGTAASYAVLKAIEKVVRK